MKRGFTLIELLVIIAIIALISTIILANLKAARDKGVNAAIKANIDTIRTQSQIVFDETGSYDTLFTPGSPALNAYNTAIAISGEPPPTGLRHSASEWIVQVKLRSGDGGGIWCTDNSGVAKRITQFTEQYACP
ncbi:MAG TPA: prepilin-type N-terminal cleavage/methylation domain-containing protein [Candidatus Nanoarchaeia archaeon]|nr:prepilin-type N-terminal cleavage/methylation domain-containing protein [Candidatus Nanoarchaeia archaeon]